MWGRWYLPMFLFRDGSLTLMNRASLIALVRFWSSLPTMVKLLILILWPVVLQWSNIGEKAFWCCLNLSAKVLADSPIYSSSHPCWLHLYLYMTPLLLVIGSLSYGTIRRLLMVCPPLKWTCTPNLLHVFFILSILSATLAITSATTPMGGFSINHPGNNTSQTWTAIM